MGGGGLLSGRGQICVGVAPRRGGADEGAWLHGGERSLAAVTGRGRCFVEGCGQSELACRVGVAKAVGVATSRGCAHWWG